MKRRYVAAAATLAALAAVWSFSLGPRLTIRVPRTAVFTSRHVGAKTYADWKTNLLPERDVLSTYDRTIRVMDAADWPRSVVVRDHYTGRDLQNGAVNYEYITEERVDPETGAWSDGPNKGDIVLFPRNVEKRTYVMRSNYVAGVPLAFSGVHDIGGLETYQFSYRGPIDVTAAYAGTAASPGVTVLHGQAIRCADDQFYYRTWVEPQTGSQVKVEEGCLSGDFVYDEATGNKVAAVDRWNGVTAGADLAARITEVYKGRRAYRWAAVYLPMLLLAGSVGILLVGYSRQNKGDIA